MNHSESAVRQAFQQAQKLDALDHVSRTLLHDLRNSLGGISGASELISIDEETSSSSKELLHVILSSTDSALDIISTLTQFIHSRESAQGTIDVHHFLEQEYKFIISCLGATASLELQYSASTPTINCNELLLAHTTMNLVLNAKESLHERGRLSISTSDVHINNNQRFLGTLITPGAYLDLCFTDTGCGIAPDLLSTVCEAGYSNRDDHAGMGLVFADEFMRQLAGYLCIESTQGVGSKIHLLFPQ